MIGSCNYCKYKTNSAILYTLFESFIDPKNKPLESFFKSPNGGEWDYQTLPANAKKVNNLGNVLPPTRGGFIWPGQSYLKFQLKQLFTKI